MLPVSITDRLTKEQFRQAPAPIQSSILQNWVLDRGLTVIPDMNLLVDVKGNKFKIDAAENGAELGLRETLHLAAP